MLQGGALLPQWRSLFDQLPAVVALVYVCTYNERHVLRVGRPEAASNLAKHSIDFADAAIALEDEAAVTVADEFADEERFITIGSDALGRLLVVVYTWRGEDTIRLISARKATPSEHRQYEG